ncbi:MAG: AAA family ATPase [Alphaproteobacteria bacterium]|nr:AAA family ATPase [Alphaproteobacteria bacterium]
MPLQLEFNSQFEKAVELIENTANHIFITGKAGSGKSTLLNYIKENTSKNMVVVAPTGVAALNVKGQTIHRFFAFPINVTPEKISNLEVTPRVKRIYKQLQTLVIDEASMLRADVLDCIDTFLQIYGPNTKKSFGGVQLVLVGDLYQLPPVVTNDEIEFFNKKYKSPYFFSSDAYKKINLTVIELNKIYRQKDEVFINLLSRIRNNSATNHDLDMLNKNYSTNDDDGFRISLTTTNKMADNINKEKLEMLNSKTFTSHATIEGNFNSEYYPTSDVLELKIGAQIMFLNNDVKNRWVNGSLGKIEDIKSSDDKIRYLCIRLQSNSKLVEVFPYEWEIYKYSLIGKEIISDKVGSFCQFPLRLAWAVTIHKSQGQTFDKVCIDIGNGTFASGQLYVALSRCTSLNGIVLRKKLLHKHILCDERIADFMMLNTPYNDENSKITVLKKAINLRKKIIIHYQKIDGNKSCRVIIPLKIKNDNLLAFCTQRLEQRTFNIERILEINNFND